MYDICCIGHITLDKIVTPKNVVFMPGGTSTYFSNALCNIDLRYLLVTILAEKELHCIKDLESKGIEVKIARFSPETVYFENNYALNPDHRTQRVLQQSVPFSLENLDDISAKIFHLGPLLADDIPIEIIEALSRKGKISLDAQGYLRKVEDQKVHSFGWPDKKKALQYVDILKVNEDEMQILTGHRSPKQAALILHDWGVKEIIITCGSRGSIIYDGNTFYNIPAFCPFNTIIDATGCGDTYMAGYLHQRIKGASYQQAGEFAAAMATLKIESSGPFTGTEKNVDDVIVNPKRQIFFPAFF
jgi:sugar/nucleoside kinase (ribokinase family)